MYIVNLLHQRNSIQAT